MREHFHLSPVFSLGSHPLPCISLPPVFEFHPKFYHCRREDPMAMYRVVCPKPRRVAPLRFHIRDDAESKADAELLGLILRKDDFKAEQCATLSSSPPFCFGSPPCRTPNPVVQDAHFGAEKLCYMGEAPTNSASRHSSHAREQSRYKQAAVRVVGFESYRCPSPESVDCI